MGILDNLKNVLGGKKADTSAESQTGANIHTVQSGETLWRIANQHYGDGSRYLEVFEANKDVLADPDHIEPGQQLRIP
jgi:nucleoid-associated protein YgaU